MKTKKTRKTKISDLAGTWNITDKEVKEMFNSLKRGWHKWKIKTI